MEIKQYTDIVEAIKQSSNYQNVFLVQTDKVIWDTWTKEKAEQLENNYQEIGLIEARFFSEDGEIHIFKQENDYVACEKYGDENEDYVTETYEKQNQRLTVKKYVDYDEDGQVVITYSRFYRLEQKG